MSSNKTFIRNLKRLFEAFSFQRLLVLMLFISTVCALGVEAEKRKKPKKEVSPIPLEWEGEYQGWTGGFWDSTKLRKMNVIINPFEKGTSDITGEIHFYPAELMDTNSYFGSYYFQGEYDDETGDITIQGVEWIAYPVNIYGQPSDRGFSFALFQGFVDKVSNEIHGTVSESERIWQMSTKYSDVKDRSFPLKWQGEGHLFRTGTDELSAKTEVQMLINPFSKEDKDVSGTIDMYVYNLNDISDRWVYKCKGEFTGCYDEDNNTLISEDIRWVEGPNFDLMSFKAIVSADMSKMDLWKDHHLYSIYKNYDSNFKAKRDNNKFSNSRSGFKGSETYKITNDFLETLCKKIGEVHRSDIKKAMDEKWNGSSFGISATMGLAYEKQLSLLNISQEDTNYYYNIHSPRDNAYLRDTINYYDLLQDYLFLFEVENENEIKNYCGYDIQSFLNQLVLISQKFAKKQKVLLLSYDWHGKWHTVLITGYYFNEKKNQYELKICDPNIRNKFSYMTIRKDFSDCKLQGKLGSKIKKMKYSSLTSLSDKLHINNVYNPYISNQNLTYIKFSSNSEFSFTTSMGYSFSYDKDGFHGTLPIVSSNIFCGNHKSTIVADIGDYDGFNVTVNSKNIDLTIYNRKGLKAIKGSQIDTIELSVSGDIKLIGKTFSFKAYSTVDKKINTNEKGMASIAAKAKEEVVIKKGQDFVEATSTQPMSSIETKVYIGTEVVTEKVKGNQESISVKATE